VPGAPHRRPKQRVGPAGPGDLPREECAQRRGNLLGRPVAAKKLEVHRTQRACAVPAPGFTANARPRERHLSSQDGALAQARSPQDSVPARIRPCRMPGRLARRRGRTHRRINAAGHQDSAAGKDSKDFRSVGELPPFTALLPARIEDDSPRTDQRSRADRTPARRIGGAPCQGPRAARSSNARGTPAARVVPKKSGTLQDEAKPWPKPGPMLTRQRALLRRPQPPRRLNRRQPACPAPPPHR
jgi:hypothetical protein